MYIRPIEAVEEWKDRSVGSTRREIDESNRIIIDRFPLKILYVCLQLITVYSAFHNCLFNQISRLHVRYRLHRPR